MGKEKQIDRIRRVVSQEEMTLKAFRKRIIECKNLIWEIKLLRLRLKQIAHDYNVSTLSNLKNRRTRKAKRCDEMIPAYSPRNEKQVTVIVKSVLLNSSI